MEDLPYVVMPLMLAQGDYGAFSGVITLLQSLLVVGGSIGILAGLAVIATAGPNSNRHQLGIYLLEGSGAGLILGLSAEPLYDLILKLVVGI